jgi:hypothetical protein
MKLQILGLLPAVVIIGFSPAVAAPDQAPPATQATQVVQLAKEAPGAKAAPVSVDPTPSPAASAEKPSGQPADRMAPIPTEARRMALELAGAFQNDGFRVRDGEWGGTLTKGDARFLRLTLFAGESYWVIAATPTQGATLRVTLYDAQGKALKTEQWKDESHGIGSRCAVGVAPDQSGKYFASVELIETSGDLPAEFSLIYAYK